MASQYDCSGEPWNSWTVLRERTPRRFRKPATVRQWAQDLSLPLAGVTGLAAIATSLLDAPFWSVLQALCVCLLGATMALMAWPKLRGWSAFGALVGTYGLVMLIASVAALLGAGGS